MTEFDSDRTSSNKCGVTLMNNQVGHVVAEVMGDKEDITISEYPSMIRVDGINSSTSTSRRSPTPSGGDFGDDDFEEISSTHYGRMVRLDDKTILCSPAPRTPPSTSASTSKWSGRPDRVREERGEVLHRRQPPALLGREPGELVPGAEEYAKG